MSELQTSTSCLPINVDNDVDDITTEIVCQNSGQQNSKIDVVEAYLTLTKVAVTSFIISFSPMHEIKTNSPSVFRRPDCRISEDICAKKKVVTFCQQREVEYKKRGIINKSSDLVYFTSINAKIPSVCFDTLKNDACCSYVSPLAGICQDYTTIPQNIKEKAPDAQEKEENNIQKEDEEDNMKKKKNIQIKKNPSNEKKKKTKFIPI